MRALVSRAAGYSKADGERTYVVLRFRGKTKRQLLKLRRLTLTIRVALPGRPSPYNVVKTRVRLRR